MEEKIFYDSDKNIKLCGILNKSNKDKIVIMCHGIRGNKEECGSFTYLAEKLHEEGYSFFRFDFNGHGESSGEDLLSKDVKYYENPIDDPCNNFEEVVKLWEVVADNQKDIDYKFNIISYSEKLCIINWQMTRTMTSSNQKQEIDGIFQISLDKNGLCTYFKQWRYTR